MLIHKNTLFTIDDEDITNGRLIVPSKVKKIGTINRSSKIMKELIVKGSLSSVEDSAFYKNYNLEKVCFCKDVESLGFAAFSECKNLKEVKFLGKVKKMDEFVFEECSALEEISLPQGLSSIPFCGFLKCTSLQKVRLPEGVSFIDESAFSECEFLTDINFPESLVRIDKQAFLDSSSLENITLPSSLEAISSAAFKGTSLTSLTLPPLIKRIDEEAFMNTCIKDLSLNEGLEVIQAKAFQEANLEKLVLPKSLKVIEENAFSSNKNLKEIVFNEGLEEIQGYAFFNSISLESVHLPKSLKSVGEHAFKNCPKLKKVVIEGGTIDPFAFDYERIDEFVLTADCHFKGLCYSLKGLNYITKEGQYFKLTKESLNESSLSLSPYAPLSLGILLELFDKRQHLARVSEDKILISLYDYLYSALGSDKFNEFIENGNIKFFKNVLANHSMRAMNGYTSFLKLYYNLGGFEKPTLERRISKSGKVVEEKVDYSQRVSEFMKEHMSDENYEIDFGLCKEIASKMEILGFNRDFTRFFLDKDNFKLLLEENEINPGFIAKCYNSFQDAQKLNTSNKGKQRQLKATVDNFKKYIKGVRFEGENEENHELAQVISKYTTLQSSFDNALNIERERKEKNSPENILSTPVVDTFDDLNALTSQIKTSAKNLVDTALEINLKNFSFEWLAKNDPRNYILGKLCNCCAHLEAVGYGVMRASIVDPNIQTLVIKNNDEIISKATLYVNKERGYGVFNTVEISNTVPHKDHLYIYAKLKLGTMAFCEQYNKEHPDNPITCVTVGGGSNELLGELFFNEKFVDKPLPSFDYSYYGYKENNYAGDAFKEQFTFWEKD